MTENDLIQLAITLERLSDEDFRADEAEQWHERQAEDGRAFY